MLSKNFSLFEFRHKINEDLDIDGSDIVILMCAMLIASIGLNMNSIPVIIGAMLISPLMTPILAMGFALATLDLGLFTKAIKLLGVEVAVSLMASTLYFLLSPITYASHEIIARTAPTIWDVVIAFVGGIAGIIGARKKYSNNIVPGVAIATALMPPVCTVGYAIAVGNVRFFFGSLYLFIINCGFIMLATMIGVRVMMVGKRDEDQSEQAIKVNKFVTLIAALIIIPSLVSASQLVQDSIRKEAVSRYISNEFQEYIIISRNYDAEKQEITLTLSGEYLSEEKLSELETKQQEYGISQIHFRINQVSNINDLNQEQLLKYIDQLIQKRTNIETNNEDQILEQKVEDQKESKGQ